LFFLLSTLVARHPDLTNRGIFIFIVFAFLAPVLTLCPAQAPFSFVLVFWHHPRDPTGAFFLLLRHPCPPYFNGSELFFHFFPAYFLSAAICLFHRRHPRKRFWFFFMYQHFSVLCAEVQIFSLFFGFGPWWLRFLFPVPFEFPRGFEPAKLLPTLDFHFFTVLWSTTFLVHLFTFSLPPNLKLYGVRPTQQLY